MINDIFTYRTCNLSREHYFLPIGKFYYVFFFLELYNCVGLIKQQFSLHVSDSFRRRILNL